MKVLSVTGISSTGKTTIIENIILELKKRGYSVGSVKEIHFDDFTIDTKGKNTYRHKMAGSELVTALHKNETDIMFQKKLDIYDLLKNYNQDYVLLEGVSDAVVPNIAVASNIDNLKITEFTFLISGVISNDKSIKDIKNIPVINSIDNIEKLVDLIEKKVPNLLPNFSKKCCGMCGYDCKSFLIKYLNKEIDIEKCKINYGRKTCLKFNNKEIDLVPFVDNILYNEIYGIVKELKGYKKGDKVEIILK